MRRVIEFLRWRAKWWIDRAYNHTINDKSTSEGLVSYANRQAALQLALAASFQSKWERSLKEGLGGDDEEETPEEDGEDEDEDEDEDEEEDEDEDEDEDNDDY